MRSVAARATTLRLRRWLLLLATFVALSLFLFAPVINGSFLSDDFLLVRGVRSAGLSFHPFGHLFFRPSAVWSLWLDYRIWGLNPVGYHLTNVVLHAVSCVALFHVGERLGMSRSAAALAAVLCLTAPAHSEPVTWISCRMDLLATSTGLSALSLWLTARERGNQRLHLVALILLMIALLSKEAAAPLCAIIIAIELQSIRLQSQCMERRRTLQRVLFIGGTLLCYLIVRRVALGQWMGGYEHTRRPNAARIAANLASFTVRSLTGAIPTSFIWFYRIWWTLQSHPLIAISGAALALVGGLAVWRKHARHEQPQPIGILIIAYALTLLPVLNLSVSLDTVEGERFLYLPSAMLFLLVAIAFDRLLPVQVRRLVAAAFVAFYMAALPHALTPWREASRLTNTLLLEIAEASRLKPITLINLPDDVRGAYVFRNGLPDALLMMNENAPSPSILVLHRVMSSNEVARVQLGDASIDLQLTDPRSFAFSASAPPGMTLDSEPFGQRHLSFHGTVPHNLWMYSAGHVQPLNEVVQ